MDDVQKQDAEDTDQMSVIGGGIEITGNIEATVDLHLIGKVVGDVRCKTLILGEGAEIRGSVHADRVRASGLIDGSVETGDLAVEATARLTGDITYSRVRIANGAVVDGRMTHKARTEEPEREGKRLRVVGPGTPPERPQQEAIVIE